MDHNSQHRLPVMFGTVGETFTTYSILFGILGALAPVLLGLGLGYAVGQRIDVVAEYRRLVGSVGVGSTLGVALGGIVIVFVVTPAPDDIGSFLLGL